MSAHVETELLAYLDGELTDPERARVEAHLAECTHCAAELDRLRLLQGELSATLDTALARKRLPVAADRRIRDRLLARTQPRWWWAVWQRRGLAAQALLALMVLLFTFTTYQTLQLPPPAGPQQTLVLGQDELAPGSQAALRVIVSSADEARPIANAGVVVRIGRTPGLASVVYTGRTDESGSADVAFTVPTDLEGAASLVVETDAAGAVSQVVRPITVARQYRLFLSSDKPAYRPGQTVHLRALALDAATLRPAAGETVLFTILAADGWWTEVRAATVSEFGVAAADVFLPSGVPHGPYTLRVQLDDTVSERTVTIGDYEMPAFSVAVETDRTFYAPGDRVEGVVRAETFFGRPVAGGQVTLSGSVDGLPVAELLGQTDDAGAFTFTLDLPVSTGPAATLDLEVVVEDAAGQREEIRHLLPVADQPILIDAVPESGQFMPGVANDIYILTAYPDGEPVATTLTIRAEGQEHQLATDPYGLAVFRVAPGGAVLELDVRARDAEGAEGQASFTFRGEPGAQALLLRAERAVYEVGDTLRLEALTAGVEDGQTVYLDVVRAGQTVVVLSAPIEDGRAVFAVDLDGTMVGTLELHAYVVLPDGRLLEDTRLVVVDAPRQVAVAVYADREQYRPGETAQVRLQTTITAANGTTAQPVQSALGIGVVDRSVYALDELPPGFARAYLLLERELVERRYGAQGFDGLALLGAEAETRAAQDVAARAAWAGATGTGFTLSARATTEQPPDVARLALSNRLGLLLALIPLLFCGVVLDGLRVGGVLGRALRRVGIGALVLLLVSPVVVAVVGGAMWLLWKALGVGAPVVVLVGVVALLVGLALHGWLRRDARVQLATGLLAAYMVLGGLLVYLAAHGGDLGGLLLVLITLTFLLTVAALVTLGQGLVLEGWRRAGWAATALALLMVILAVYMPLVPGLNSSLTRTLGNPALYAGPVGWLTGCGAAPTMPAATEMPPEATEAPPAEETSAPPEVPTAAPTEAPTEEPPPVEPFPLRQVFPETLYWNAEALTDEEGRLTLDLPLADTITTWQLTALASTRDGELGVAALDIVVFQDFFAEIDLPPTIAQGEVVTATVVVYNYLPQAQTVRLEMVAADWYNLLSPASAVSLDVPAQGIAATTFVIRAERTGRFSLQVTAVGAQGSDAIAHEVTVAP